MFNHDVTPDAAASRPSAAAAALRAGAGALLTAGLLALGSAASWAQDAAAAAPAAAAPAALKNDTGDTAWLLVSTALVLFMTPGLALFYGGMVRAKNILNILMQSFVAVSVVTVVWVVVGYSLAFAPGSSFLGNLSYAGLGNVGQDPITLNGTDLTVPHQLFMMFQLMFAIITPALISGAIAERMKFSAYVVFIALWSLLAYSPMAHMVWGEGGYLFKLGALDFAGGTVVHILSGISALVLAIMLGKRRLERAEDLRPHNLPMTLIGTGILWFGWFGFNAGSAVASGGLAANALMVTHIAAAVAGLTWILIEWVVLKQPTALGWATGAVAGLVAITPAAGFVGPIPAIAIGCGVAFISYFAIKMKARLGYDDTLDVFGVHCVGGIWGALATGLFAQSSVNPGVLAIEGSPEINGLFFGGGVDLLVKQAVGVAIALVLGAVMTFLIASVLKVVMGGIRASAEEEEAGLDLTQHGEVGYAGATGGSDPTGLGHGAPVHAAASAPSLKPEAAH
jgi:Amt family ammonium transporter